MTRELREVVFVDGVRTPFGKAKGQYAETRADDLVVKLIRDWCAATRRCRPSGSTTWRSLRPPRSATRA